MTATHHMKQWILLAGFIALGVTLGYALLTVPNVEMVTATIFLCGYLMGVPFGMLCGVLTELIYGLFNPYGAAAPPLLLGMVAAMAVTGAAGGWLGRTPSQPAWLLSVRLATAGALCTVNFAVLTTLGYLVSVGIVRTQLIPGLIAGMGFYLTHILGNTLIFMIALPFLIRVLQCQWKRLALGVTAFCLILPMQTRAQFLTLDKAPFSGYRHLGDLAATLPGVWLRDTGYLGHETTIRIQGRPQTLSQLTYNGFLIDDPLTGLTDLRLIPVTGVDRISLSGTDSLGFLTTNQGLSVSSRRLKTDRPYTRVVYRPGRDKSSDLDFAYGQKLSRKVELLAGVLLKDEGDNETGTLTQKYHGQSVRIGARYIHAQWLRVAYHFLHNKLEADSIEYPVVLPMVGLGIIDPAMDQHRVDHMLRSEVRTAGLHTEIRFHRTDLQYRVSETDARIPTRLRGRGRTWQFSQCLGRFPHVQWGAQYKNALTHPLDTLRFTHNRFRAFFRSRWMLSPVLTLQANGTYHHGYEDLLLGKSRLTWKPRSSISLWTGVDRSIREPLLGERYGRPFWPAAPSRPEHLTMQLYAGGISANDALKPEQSARIEGGVRLANPGRFSVALRGYGEEIVDIIQLNRPDQYVWRFDNLDTYQLIGMDLNAELHLGRFTNRILLNYLKAEDASEAILLERPNLWGLASVSWHRDFFERDLILTVMLQSRFRSDFFSVYGRDVDTFQPHYHDPVALIDFRMLANIMEHAVIAFSLDNMLDTRTSVVGTYWQNGRTWRLGYYWELFD